jgi:hypothetical protein
MGSPAEEKDSPRYTNHLINETSPYLLQHAHNPVDWYPWGKEALKKARVEDKPILLSIGYAACHWCHRLSSESFEDEETARIMNELFVNVKVDREERPDLDHIYMNFIQMTTGTGGWPMTVFLTPTCVPFFGGTYFPPTDNLNLPSFKRVLLSVSEAYRRRPDETHELAISMLGELRRLGIAEESNEVISLALLDDAYRNTIRNYDATNGGFGGAPKFPAPMNMDFILRLYKRTGHAAMPEKVTHTCHKMAEGGIYDQLGGGFHRYSTDARWLVPHFEKMLYDNAQLSRTYLHVYQITGDDFYRHIAEDIYSYILREMTSPEGGFYSTQDADSEDEEGKFFVWTVEEVKELLGEEEGSLFCSYYDVSETGNFEGKNILNIRHSIAMEAAEQGIEVEKLREILERGKKILFEAREKRVKPFRDEKILTAWNGLMLESFAEAAAILDRKDYLEVAIRNAKFVLDNLRSDNGLLLRTYKDGQAKLNAYLEDYAYYASGLIALYETTGNVRWLSEARAVADLMIEEFWDQENGGFYFTGKSHEELIIRAKDYFDSATPSGNSVAAEVLLKLDFLTGKDDYGRIAVSIFRLLTDSIRRYGSAFGRVLCAMDFHLSTPKEIVILGQPDAQDTKELLRTVWSTYLPNKVVVLSDGKDKRAQELIPLLQDKTMIDGKATAYVCENYACQQPVTTAKELAAQLS